MKSYAIVLLLTLAGVAAPAHEMGFMPADPQAQRAASREDELYARMIAARDESRWTDAVKVADQLIALKGRRAEGGLFWKAYAYQKMGDPAAALATIAQLRKEFPQSTWLNDAGALELQINQAGGRTVAPEQQGDEELKLLAINSLMNSEPQRAIPLLVKILEGNQSQKLKERALFVLAQHDSPEAQGVLAQIVQGQRDPDLQRKAIRYLGISGRKDSLDTLAKLYAGTTNSDVREEILKAYGIAGRRDLLLQAARSEKDPELRAEAIKSLGIAGGHEELRAIYKESQDKRSKEAVLQGMIISGDSQGIAEIVQSETDPELKGRAIQNLGIVGGPNVGATLLNLYNSNPDLSIKKRVITALFIKGDAKTLIDLARKETNPEMRKEIVTKLSVMNNREANEYLMELLNK